MISSALFKTVSKSRHPSPKPLTHRENEILSSLSRGSANKEIAEQMNISVPTVRTHLRHIYEKLAVRSRAEAIVKYFNEIRPAGVSMTVAERDAVPVRQKHGRPQQDRRTEQKFVRHQMDTEESSLQIEEFGE